MINKKLSTNNIVLNALNEEYPVMKFIGFAEHPKNSFIVYEPIEGDWANVKLDDMKFVCLVTTKGNKKVVWNDTEYTSSELLMADVDKYNAQRMFPAWTYNPQYTEDWRYPTQIGWFAQTKLGLCCEANERWFIEDLDSHLFSFTLPTTWDLINEVPSIHFTLYGQHLFQAFTSTEEACESIYSLYVTFLGQLANSVNVAVNRLPADVTPGDLSTVKKFDPNSWSFKSVKDQLVVELEKILAVMKGE